MDPKIKAFFKDKKVLVTGGTGLVGTQLLKLLQPVAMSVTSISLDNLKPIEGVIYKQRDLRYFDACLEEISGQDIVFHVAGIKGNPDVTSQQVSTVFVPYLQFNTNVLEACRLCNVKRVVYTSTIGAYASAEVLVDHSAPIMDGTPMDMWAGTAKRMGEMQISSYKKQYKNFNFCAVRPANIYGPYDNFDPDNAMVIPSLMMKIARGDNPVEIWGHGLTVRDFIYSEDVAMGLIHAAYYMVDVPFLNMGTGVGYLIKELVKILQTIVPFKYVFDDTKPSGFPKRVMDMEMTSTLLKFHPYTDLRSGLAVTWEWFLDHKEEYLQRQNYFK